MTATVFLHITSCATNAGIPHATITDEEVGGSSQCDASGNLTFVWDDTDFPQYQIMASAAGFDSAPNIFLVPQMNGTTQTFCLNPAPSGGGGGGGGGCLVATAAYGSAVAPQVKRLGTILDSTVTRTGWGRAFFDALSAEYYTYSPRIADEMAALPPFRESVRELFVAPFLDFLTTVKSIIASDENPSADDEVMNILRKPPACDPIAVARELTASLESLTLRNQADRPAPPPFPPPSDAVGVVRYIVGVARGLAPCLDLSRWALLEPVTLHWQALADVNRSHRPISEISDEYGVQILKWTLRMQQIPGNSTSPDALVRGLVVSFSGLADGTTEPH